MNKTLKPILDYLLEKRGFDFSGYHHAMLERRIAQRLTATSSANFSEYLSCLQKNAAELDHLIDVITINVSRFFRDTLTFELIANRILPAIIREKTQARDYSLRVWSAGCANGEEPYSLVILIHELLEKEGLTMNLHIFATDIDARALKDAEKAIYPLGSVENIKHRLLTKYFAPDGTSFRLMPEIKKLVTFSLYDMLDKKHGVPPESVFGAFDLVLCRNLLIYFNIEYQETIFARLYHSLAKNGILILGEAEAPTIKYQRCFSRVIDFSPIYRKR
ncbi:MAG: chemotaxis protein CheR [Syntrophus sp. (in: bacteria)]|nr:chemotaxis protein CheR [Syntrophus sp. (in: bacteria)]